MFVCCSVAIFLHSIACGSRTSQLQLHIPLLARSQSEREEDRCDNCTNESYLCPPWYKPTTGGSCKFGAQVGGAVTGIGSTMQTTLLPLYCITPSNVSSTGNEVLGSCLLSLPDSFGAREYTLPCNISDLNNFICASTNGAVW